MEALILGISGFPQIILNSMRHSHVVRCVDCGAGLESQFL